MRVLLLSCMFLFLTGAFGCGSKEPPPPTAADAAKQPPLPPMDGANRSQKTAD